jgi:hypothetical protein
MKNNIMEGAEQMSDKGYQTAPLKKLYVVDVLSSFRLRYVVEAKEESHALDEVVCRESETEFKEFSQEHLGTNIIDSREISLEQYHALFLRDNQYLKGWQNEQQRTFINKIEYTDEENSNNG